MHEFAAKKTQGKNHAMQRHEQFLPPCRCIAQINEGESLRVDSMRGRWGVGGGRYLTKLAGERTSADIPCPNLVSHFQASFWKCGKLAQKKKETDSKTATLVLDKNKG
jgi:hypothetical protein